MKTRTLLLTFDALLPSSSHVDGRNPFSNNRIWRRCKLQRIISGRGGEMELHVSPGSRNDCSCDPPVYTASAGLTPSAPKLDLYLLVLSCVLGL